MATINAPSLQDTVYSGESPLAVAHGYITLAAAAANDKVRLNKLFAGTKIYAAKAVSAAIGADIDLGIEYVNGEAGGSATALLTAGATTAAGAVESKAAPLTLAYDAYLIATVKGAATGKLDTVVTYEFKGK
jgi:hypothetical protein